jgi:ribosomal protein S18 acetylase RimI-like enzyme
MKPDFTDVASFGVAQTAKLLTGAFADYFVKIAFTEPGLRQMERTDSVDFEKSRIVLLEGVPVGAALIARRATQSRLAGMAVLPEARRRGVARALVQRLLADAQARGDRRMVLEVIEQNAAAVRLYESAGFRRKRRLVGFVASPATGGRGGTEVTEVSLRDVAGAVRRLDAEVEWPWQISGQTIALLPAQAMGYALDGAWVAVLNPGGPVFQVRALAVEGLIRCDERAAALLRALMSRHPAGEWRMSAVWPEELSSWFSQAGFVRQELTQWQMGRSL